MLSGWERRQNLQAAQEAVDMTKTVIDDALANLDLQGPVPAARPAPAAAPPLLAAPPGLARKAPPAPAARLPPVNPFGAGQGAAPQHIIPPRPPAAVVAPPGLPLVAAAAAAPLPPPPLPPSTGAGLGRQPWRPGDPGNVDPWLVQSGVHPNESAAYAKAAAAASKKATEVRGRLVGHLARVVPVPQNATQYAHYRRIELGLARWLYACVCDLATPRPSLIARAQIKDEMKSMEVPFDFKDHARRWGESLLATCDRLAAGAVDVDAELKASVASLLPVYTRYVLVAFLLAMAGKVPIGTMAGAREVEAALGIPFDKKMHAPTEWAKKTTKPIEGSRVDFVTMPAFGESKCEVVVARPGQSLVVKREM